MKISYYKLERPDVEGGFRSYWLMEGDKQARMIHISSLIRLQGLLFSPGPGGPAGREPGVSTERNGRQGCSFAGGAT